MVLATFAERWRQAVAAVPDRPAFVWEARDGRVATWSYAELDQLVAQVAGGLVARGVAPGASVHLVLANSPAFVATWLACTRLGAWIVPSDPSATAPELAGHLRRTTPVLSLCAPDRADAARAAATEVGVPLVEVDEDDPTVGPLAAAPLDAGHPWPRPHDRAAVMFTSGTTSAPKGVEVTQANYAFAGDVMAAAAGLTAHDRQLVVLPMFHANAQYYSWAAAIAVGASVAMVPAFSASGFVAQAARHQATHASLFAAPIRMILARGAEPDPADRAALRLRHCWFAQNLTADQYDAVADLLGCRPRQLYGMTETIPAVLTSRALTAGADRMGEPTLGCEVEVHDDDGRPCAPGVVGEVVIGGTPGETLFAGYLDDPATTAASFRELWFRSGDRAFVDDDGRFAFAGRGSDVLKVAGENVSVVEVEAAIAEHPAVLEVAVVGEPDPVRDEVPAAYVVLRPDAPAALNDATALADELRAWCAVRLAKAKRPHRYELVDELPRTSVGKIRKFMLRRESAIEPAGGPR
jgi:carnitine-CoA ligase